MQGIVSSDFHSEAGFKLVLIAIGSFIYSTIDYSTASERERQQHAERIDQVLDELRQALSSSSSIEVRGRGAAPCGPSIPCNPALPHLRCRTATRRSAPSSSSCCRGSARS